MMKFEYLRLYYYNRMILELFYGNPHDWLLMTIFSRIQTRNRQNVFTFCYIYHWIRHRSSSIFKYYKRLVPSNRLLIFMIYVLPLSVILNVMCLATHGDFHRLALTGTMPLSDLLFIYIYCHVKLWIFFYEVITWRGQYSERYVWDFSNLDHRWLMTWLI